MDFNPTDMSFEVQPEEPVNVYTDDRAARAAADAVIYTGDTELYAPIKNQLVVQGESEIYEAVAGNAKSGKQTAAIEHASTLGNEADKDLIVREVLTDSEEVNLEAEALKQSADRYTTSSVADILRVESAEEFIAIAEAGSDRLNSAVSKLFLDVTGEDGTTIGETIAGIAELIIPTNETAWSARMSRAVKKQLELGFTEQELLIGSGLDELRKLFNKAPTVSDKLDFVSAFGKALNDTGSYLGNDEILKIYAAQFIFSDYLNGTSVGDREGEVMFNNLMTIADVVPAVAAIRAGIKALTGTRVLTKVDKLAAVNPKEARAAATEGIKSDEVAQGLGATREDLALDSILSKWTNEAGETVNLVNAPSKVKESLAITQAYGEQALNRLQRFGYITTDIEKANTIKNAQEFLSSKPGLHYLDGDSVTRTGFDFFETTAKYAKTEDGAGWASAGEAVQALKSEFPDSVITAVPRRHVVSGPDVAPVDFLASVSLKRPYNDPKGMIFGPNSVYVTSKFGEYATDSASRYAQYISRANSRAFDLEKGVQANLDQLLKPLVKLNNKGKQKVVGWLDEGASGHAGDTKGFVYSVHDLVAKGASEAEMSAYYAARQLNDVFYVASNRRYRQEMQRQGFQEVIETGAKNTEFSESIPFKRVPKESLPPNLREAYNPVTGNIDTIPEGASVARLMETATDAATQTRGTNYVILNNTQRDLPQNVLRYDQGYVSTKYTDAYIVQRLGDKRIIDGVQTTNPSTLFMARTLNEANKIVAKKELNRTESITRLESQLVGANLAERAALLSEIKTLESQTYRALHESKFTNQDKIKAEVDVDRLKGRLFFSKKGDRLQQIEGLADIQDPITAMSAAKTVIARAGVYSPLVQTHKNRFLNTFSDLLPEDLRRTRSFPATEAQISVENSLKGLKDAPRVAEAQSLFRMIDNLENPTDEIANWWQSRMISIADSLGGGVLAQGALAVAKKDPMKLARGFNFVTMIALNPVRQIFVQSQQLLFLAGINPKYIMTGAISKDYMGLVAGYLAKPSAKHRGAFPYTLDQVAKIGAKTMGVSTQEYKAIVKSFRESGLPNSMDSHMLSHDATVQLSAELTRTKLQAAGKLTHNFLSKAVEIPRKYGFDFGEFNNLVGSWLVARKAYLKANPGASMASGEAIDTVASLARQYALDMTAQGSFKHQRGMLSLMTQFLSIQQKAWLAILPGKAGNKVFSAAEKRRMFTAQLLMYGTTGWGLTEAWQAAKKKFQIDTSPQVDALVEAGLYEWVFNTSLTAFTGEEQSIRVSSSIAAGGGIMDSLGAIVDDFIDGERSALEIFAGASAASYDRISNATGHMRFILSDASLDTDEKIFRGIEVFGQVASGVTAYTRFRMSQNIQAAVTANGSAIIKNTYAERIAKGVLGLGTQEEAKYWDTVQDVSKRKKALREDAKVFYDYALRDITRYDLDTGSSLDDRTRLAFTFSDKFFSHMMAALGPEDGTAMWAEIQDIMKFERSQTGASRLSQAVIRLATEGKLGNPWAELQALKELGEIDEETMSAILRASSELTEAVHANFTQDNPKEEK